jgi:hypothetical protein
MTLGQLRAQRSVPLHGERKAAMAAGLTLALTSDRRATPIADARA